MVFERAIIVFIIAKNDNGANNLSKCCRFGEKCVILLAFSCEVMTHGLEEKSKLS